MSQLYTPFRYDFVGSFLRPEYLKKARADYEAGAMSAEELKKTEDKAITELVAKQKEAGYHVITDGEFRRATWHLDFMWAFDGVGHSKTETGLPFHGEAAMIDDTYVTGKISYKNKKLKKGSTYSYKVRAYMTVEDTDYFGGYSAVAKIKVK